MGSWFNGQFRYKEKIYTYKYELDSSTVRVFDTSFVLQRQFKMELRNGNQVPALIERVKQELDRHITDEQKEWGMWEVGEGEVWRGRT